MSSRNNSAADSSHSYEPSSETAGAAVHFGPIGWPDEEATRQRAQRSGTGGRLDELAEWAAGVQAAAQPAPFHDVRLILVAGTHGIAEANISSQPIDIAARTISEVQRGQGLLSELAAASGVSVQVLDLSQAGSADIRVTDAATDAAVSAGLSAGAYTVDGAVDSGAELLILADVATASTAVAASIISVLTATEPLKCIGRGAGIDDETWMRKMSAVRDARTRAWPRRYDSRMLLSALGGADMAAMTAILQQAAARRTPVIIDGVVGAAAAMLAQREEPLTVQWIRPGHRSAEPAQTIALKQLGLQPIIDLQLRRGTGIGALLGYRVLRAATLL